MVRKLYKHELRSWIRFMSIVYVVVLAVATMHRLLQLFETDSVYYNIVFFSATLAYIVVLYASFLATVVWAVIRFYRNLFTSEGYLTMTLPVPVSAHLWVKVSTAVLFSILTYLVAIFSFLIVTAGDVFIELCKAGAYLWKEVPSGYQVHLVFLGLEFLLLVVVSLFCNHLLYDTCICIGQLFRRLRILAAIGAYFAYYMITQTLSTIGSMLFSVLMAAGALDWLGPVVEDLQIYTVHIGFGIGLLVMLILAAVYYLFCHFVIRRRLNLE